jgi:hypothetical protein
LYPLLHPATAGTAHQALMAKAMIARAMIRFRGTDY